MPSPSEPRGPRRDAVPPARGRWRAVAAPLALAAYSAVAAVGALAALLPAALARGPVGRQPAPGPAAGAEEREALGA